MNEELDEIRRDYEGEQAYHNQHSCPPPPRDGRIARYWKGYDQPDAMTCDAVYIDRTTGREVRRYDAADPANTRFDYGASTDEDVFRRAGRDLNEMIDPQQSVVTDDALRARMQRYADDGYDEYGWYDDYGYTSESDT